ncbi:alpha/beta fold hydrolase [Streptomyces melanogenes]|uniref:alpha/beta fold hydrolase n=1 Tax=Streptomyces melanogenes TaxID=67326 RepID=UPI00167E5158|nr:alpha/beta hydrolase [Streptomyces melanogenes]GGP89401.1 hydrolase [Streptomyces melanogenes]
MSMSSVAPSPTMTRLPLSFGGFGFTAEVAQQGPNAAAPLVVLGGPAQDRFSWVRPQMGLAPLCDVVTLDLPGYGEADPLPPRYGLDFLAAAVRHAVTELGFRRVNLFGNCFGGAIALRFVQHYPAAVEHLVLAGTALAVPAAYEEAAARWLTLLTDQRYEETSRELAAWYTTTPGTGVIKRHAAAARRLHRHFAELTPARLRMTVVDHHHRLMNHEWYRPEPLPQVPALVFTGEYDRLAPPAAGRAVATALPDAVFTTVKHADQLVHWERTEEFIDLLARFVTDIPVDGLSYCTALERPGIPTQYPGGV